MDSNRTAAEGVSALGKGDHETAIRLLANAVRHDPDSARNHNNLASAYFAAGQVRKGWPHVRQAHALHPRDRVARANLLRHIGQLVHEGGLKNGVPTARVEAWLGQPDVVVRSEEGETWRYGPMGMHFQAGHLAGAKHMKEERLSARRRPCEVCQF